MGIQENLHKAEKKLETAYKKSKGDVSGLFDIRACLAEVERLKEEMKRRMK